METDRFEMTPGRWLHDAIMGALKGRGMSFGQLCEDNDVHRHTARAATHGLTNGPAGKALVKTLVDAAGRDVVVALYKQRLDEQATQAKEARR